jgi:hypothetical protein
MAMLVLSDAFERTWGHRPPEFWPRAVAAARERHPEFLFMAEVYWDLEWTLQQQGFDYTYDKRLYDRLCDRRARPVREHFLATPDFQCKSVRFLENHDEPRAAATFALEVHRAEAVLTFLCPGLRFVHQGQLAGKRKRIPVHLGRGPVEAPDHALRVFYAALFACVADPIVQGGDWQLLECRPAWDGNWTWDGFIAFAWEGLDRGRILVAVNYQESQGQCYVRYACDDLFGKIVRLQDRMSDAVCDRAGHDLAAPGLYLDLPAWGYHKMSRRDLAARPPGFVWDAHFGALPVDAPNVVSVRQLIYLKELGRMAQTAPLAEWKACLSWHLLRVTAAYLSISFEREAFAFNETNLQGIAELPPRWKRFLAETDAAFGEALGKLYIEQTFSPRAKQQALEQVANLRTAFRARLQRLA